MVVGRSACYLGRKDGMVVVEDGGGERYPIRIDLVAIVVVPMGVVMRRERQRASDHRVRKSM